VKTTVGAGIISLPYVVSKLGYLFAIVIFIAFGVLNQFCCSLLIRAKNLSRHSNYSTIMGYIWGNNFSKFLGSLTIFLDNLGTCNSSIIKAFYK
jgi:amino acid permease